VRLPGRQVRETIAVDVAHRQDQVVDCPISSDLRRRTERTGSHARIQPWAPVDLCEMTSEEASESPVRAVKILEALEAGAAHAGRLLPRSPFPPCIRRAPVPATTARTSASPSPVEVTQA
jgi:hypothetical protein